MGDIIIGKSFDKLVKARDLKVSTKRWRDGSQTQRYSGSGSGYHTTCSKAQHFSRVVFSKIRQYLLLLWWQSTKSPVHMVDSVGGIVRVHVEMQIVPLFSQMSPSPWQLGMSAASLTMITVAMKNTLFTGKAQCKSHSWFASRDSLIFTFTSDNSVPCYAMQDSVWTCVP